jgi:RHS repeat-associated protein
MSTTKSYDNLNRLTQVSAGTNGVAVARFSYAHNQANQRTSVTNVSDARWVYQYDARGQVVSGRRYWGDGTPVAGQQFEYAFDDIGNRTQTKAGGDVAGANLRTATYSANSLNQYTSRTVPGYLNVIGSAATNATVAVNSQPVVRQGEYFWKELAVANQSSALWQGITNAGVVKGATTNDPDLKSLVTGSLFVPQTPESFLHDADGNLLRDGRWTNRWDGENRLQIMEGLSAGPAPARVRVACGYDAGGRRVSKKVYQWGGGAWQLTNEAHFVYDGWNLLAVVDTNHAAQLSFVWGPDASGTAQGGGGGGGLLALRVHSGAQAGTYFYCYDGNHNVAGLVSAADGTLAAQYEYGPFGELLRATGPLAFVNPFRFSTKYQDDETGLLYYGYRYLDSGTGGWPNRDPLGEPEFFKRYARGKSLDQILELAKKGLQAGYQFAGNNPITQIDILGLENVQIVVTSVIRPPDTQAGVKTIHSVVVNEYGQIVSRNTFTGTTSIGGIAYPTGTSTFRDWVTGTHPNFTVTMIGNSSSAALPSFFDIDYNYDIHLNFCMRTGTLSGKNDGYPSYTVRVKGKTVWDWQQQTLLSLLGDGEITASAEFNW